MRAPEFTDILRLNASSTATCSRRRCITIRGFSAELGFDVLHQTRKPSPGRRVFKVRGGINLISRLSAERKRRPA
jgi:hypothetical protein